MNTGIDVDSGKRVEIPPRGRVDWDNIKIGHTQFVTDEILSPRQLQMSLWGSFVGWRNRRKAVKARLTTRQVTEGGVKGVRIWRTR